MIIIQNSSFKIRFKDYFCSYITALTGEIDMATGGMFHIISEDSARQFITQLIRVKGDEDDVRVGEVEDTEGTEAGEQADIDYREEEDREEKQQAFAEIFRNLCALVKVLNSYNTKVNVARYKEISVDTYRLIRLHFRWAQVPESLHRVLGHAWQRIEQNGCYGLGSESEEGLEVIVKQFINPGINQTKILYFCAGLYQVSQKRQSWQSKDIYSGCSPRGRLQASVGRSV